METVVRLIPCLTPQVIHPIPDSVDDIEDRFHGVPQFEMTKNVFASETDSFQVSLQCEVQHREEELFRHQCIETKGWGLGVTISGRPLPAMSLTVS